MSGHLFSRIEQSRFYDWAMRMPIVLYSLYALVTVVIPLFCVLLDRAPPNLWCNLLAVAAGVSASILGALTLSFLGRSFSVMPEARRLVTSGPYSIVRHPLYLFELLGVVGILLQVRSLPGLMLLGLIVVLQIAREQERDLLAVGRIFRKGATE